MATANTSTLKYQNSAVFDPDSPPSQIKQQRNDKDFFESLAAEKPTHLEYLKNFRLIVFERKKERKKTYYNLLEKSRRNYETFENVLIN